MRAYLLLICIILMITSCSKEEVEVHSELKQSQIDFYNIVKAQAMAATAFVNKNGDEIIWSANVERKFTAKYPTESDSKKITYYNEQIILETPFPTEACLSIGIIALPDEHVAGMPNSPMEIVVGKTDCSNDQPVTLWFKDDSFCCERGVDDIVTSTRTISAKKYKSHNSVAYIDVWINQEVGLVQFNDQQNMVWTLVE